MTAVSKTKAPREGWKEGMRQKLRWCAQRRKSRTKKQLSQSLSNVHGSHFSCSDTAVIVVVVEDWGEGERGEREEDGGG